LHNAPGLEPISTRDSGASGFVPQRIESPSLSGFSPVTGAPLRMSPFLPWLLIHQRPSENVNRACSLDTVGTSGSISSTGPRPARAPEVRVSATEEPVTSRSAGTAAGLAAMIVVRPAATVGPGSCQTGLTGPA
jgi:hypothetical protein